MTTDTTLTEQHVATLFHACIDAPKTATVHQGEIHGIHVITAGVERHWRTIGALLAQLKVDEIQQGTDWLTYMFDTNGHRWGNAKATTRLIALGMTAGYTHRIADIILPSNSDLHPDYACPRYRTNLGNRYMPSL